MLSHVVCIAFDAVGTLIYPDPPVAEVYARVGKKYGSRLSEAEVRKRFHQAFRAEFGQDGPTNEDQERSAWRRIVQRTMGIEEIEPCFEELFAHFASASSWRCFPDVKETFPRLRERGFDLIMASNFDRRLHAICEGHPELAFLSARIISSEVGVHKPAAAFFRAMRDKTGSELDELLMVGDDWTNDVRGAGEFGIQAVYLDRTQAGPVSRRDNITVISSLTQLLELLP